MGDVLESVMRAVGAAIVLVMHFALAAAIIFLIWGLEQLMNALWGVNEMRLLDVVPIRYLFHVIDLAIIAVFGFYGIAETIRTFQRRKE